MENQKYCDMCKQSFNVNSFFRIIKRTDFGLNSDNQGITYFLKPCDMCRNKALENRLKQKALF